jgi:hypothetical protein
LSQNQDKTTATSRFVSRISGKTMKQATEEDILVLEDNAEDDD